MATLLFSPMAILSNLLFFAFSYSVAHASVPKSSTFQFVNEAFFEFTDVEYGGRYQITDIKNGPFALCFHTTDLCTYTLALRMGTDWDESGSHWVWEANRGKPVKENATLTFGEDGNLALADADGQVAWQTNTGNKGVVGFKLLPNGNMVLQDAKGKFIWQSFDYPTDTLLVGQYLRANGPSRLVSRLSSGENKNGPYSLIFKKKRLVMSYKSESTSKPLVYYAYNINLKGDISNITFGVSHEDSGNELLSGNKLYLGYTTEDGTESQTLDMVEIKYNATFSFLRLGIDGNVRVFTHSPYYHRSSWDTPFTLLSSGGWDNECRLPEYCGDFGVCENNQCVACPSANGLLGWSNKCQPPKLRSCGGKTAKYYKVEGVDHFSEKYTWGEGPMKESECQSKCTRDCKCKGYFFNQKASRCWIAYELKTLSKVEDSSHVGYVKISG